MLFTRCTGTEFNTHELYEDDKLISYSLKTVCIVSYLQKKKKLEQSDENSHICVFQYVASQFKTLSVLMKFMNVYARCFDWIYFTVQLKRALES